MPSAIPKPAQRACRLGLAGVCLLLLAGCQSFTASSPAHVRVVDLSPGTATVDIYQGANALAYNLSYGTVTSYVSTTPGTYTLTVGLAGSKQVLSAAKETFATGGHYTMLVDNPLNSLQQVLLTDRAPEQSAANPSVRLIHQAPQMGAVDVYLVPAGRRLTSISPLVKNLEPGAATGYLAAPPGVCTAIVLPAGTVPSSSTVPAHTGTQLSYEAGALRSLILIDAAAEQPRTLQVIATVDAEPQD